jgi:hypothetical protein
LLPNRFASSVALAIFFVSGAVLAEPRAITLDRYSSGESPEDDFELSRAKIAAHQHIGAQVTLDYASNPLAWEANDGREVNIIGSQTTALVGFSYSLWERATFFAAMPVVLEMSGASVNETTQLGTPQADSGGVGDVYFGARVLAVGGENQLGAFAVQAALSVPTAGSAGEQYFRGDDSVTFRPELIGELHPGAKSRIMLNLGSIIRNDYEGVPYDVSDELTFALGYGIPVWSGVAGTAGQVEAVVYLRGNTTYLNAFDAAYTPIEGILGARYASPSMTLGLAAGTGIAQGMGAPDFRFALTAGFLSPVLELLSSGSQSSEVASR